MIWIVFVLVWLPGLAQADDWEALRAPGAIAIMRHALAPGNGDPAGFVLGDCATQRNLDQRGRDQARAVGAALHARGIAFDVVLTSQWCRARETAALLDHGTPRDAPSLNSFFGRFDLRAPQTRETLALLRQTEGRPMLVTHQVNITALTGRGVQSGEIVVFRLTDTGVEVLGSILIRP
jgi:phosphohistidine phosphatase SixA